MNSCKNCLYCDIKKDNKYHAPDGTVWYGAGLRTYVCMKDMLLKEPEYVCDKWEHRWRLFRLINKLR